MKKCKCGELVEDHVRFHWVTNQVGHYVGGGEEAPGKPDTSLPAHLARASVLWGDPPFRAPAPTTIPDRKLWKVQKEDDLRKNVCAYFEAAGFGVRDLEQGYRPETRGTRVAPGIADVYFTHHELRIRGWCELKRWDNEPRPDQLSFAKAELGAGGIYLLVYSVEQVSTWHRAVMARKGPHTWK